MEKQTNAQKLYTKLIENDAFVYRTMLNEKGQKIVFYEHPFYGDSAPVMVAFPEYKLAFTSDFYDIYDMANIDHSEYRPFLVDNQMIMGYELQTF